MAKQIRYCIIQHLHIQSTIKKVTVGLNRWILHLQGLASRVKQSICFYIHMHHSFRPQTVKFANIRLKTSRVAIMWKSNNGGNDAKERYTNLLNLTVNKNRLLNTWRSVTMADLLYEDYIGQWSLSGVHEHSAWGCGSTSFIRQLNCQYDDNFLALSFMLVLVGTVRTELSEVRSGSRIMVAFGSDPNNQ
jgi:hypothetical protein